MRIINFVYNEIIKIKGNILIEILNIKIIVTAPTIPNVLTVRNIITVIYRVIGIIPNIITITYKITAIIIIITVIIKKNIIPPTRIKATT